MSMELWMSLWAGHWVVEMALISFVSTLPPTLPRHHTGESLTSWMLAPHSMNWLVFRQAMTTISQYVVPTVGVRRGGKVRSWELLFKVCLLLQHVEHMHIASKISAVIIFILVAWMLYLVISIQRLSCTVVAAWYFTYRGLCTWGYLYYLGSTVALAIDYYHQMFWPPYGHLIKRQMIQTCKASNNK